MEINFFFSEFNIFHLNKKKLRNNFIKIALFEGYSINVLNIILTNDKKILLLNKKFLFHNYPTDIITFNYCKNFSLSADIYISVDTIFYNSKKFNVSFQTELFRVLIHGILHLMKFNDKLYYERKIMRIKEDFYLRLFKR